MGAYQIGELIGSAVGMVLIGAGVAWCIRKLMPRLDFRISVGVGMVLLALLAGFTNSSAGRPYLATVAMYGVAGLIAYFVVVLAWSRQQPYKSLANREDFGFANIGTVSQGEKPAAVRSTRPTTGIAWGRGFFRVWMLIAILWVVGGIGIAYTVLATPYVSGKYVGVNLESETVSLHNNYGEIARAMDDAVSNGTARKTAVRPGYALFTPVNLAPWRYYQLLETATAEVDTYIQRETVARRTQAIPGAIAGIFLPPMVVLLLGYAIGWALSGFRRTV